MSAAALALFLLLMVYGLGDCMNTPCLDLNVLHSNDSEVNLIFPARFSISDITLLVTSGDYGNTICRFRHNKDWCSAPHERCFCHKDSNTFTVKGTANSGGWKITARGNGHPLNFCRKAPQITSFSISIKNASAATNGSTVPSTLSLDSMTTVVVDVNSSLNISCSWTKTERISQSFQLPASQRPSGHSDPGGQHHDYMLHVHHHDYMAHVQCQDSGPLECPGSGVNVTRTLLVRCSPKFSEAGSGMLVKTVNTKRSSSTAFRLTTYDTDITQCRLTPLPSDDTALGHTMECPGFNVTGIVPNLTLTLTSVTLQMEGRWRLKIENRIGSSEVDFQLRIRSEEKSRVRGGVHLILTASLCALCVLFLLVVIVLLFRLKTPLIGPLRFWKEQGSCSNFVVCGNKPSQLKFPIHSHSSQFTHCWISPSLDYGETSPSASVSNSASVNCLRFIRATNPPPNMTLIFTVPDVTSQHLGKWNLTVSNDAGADYVTFGISFGDLSVPSPFPRRPFNLPDHTNRNMSTNDHDSSLGFIISAFVGAIVLIAVINIVFCLIRRYRNRRESRGRRGGRRRGSDFSRGAAQQAPEQPPYDQQPWRYSCGENETHMYWEIE